MISTTGNSCALSITSPTAPDKPVLPKSRELTEQKTCTETQIAKKLNLAEITAIAKTNKYLNGIHGEEDFRRVGIESQCNGIAIVKTTQTTLPSLRHGDVPQWYYPRDHHDGPPHEVLLKGQILARTEQTAAGIPLIALTVEREVNGADLSHIHIPELITAPLTRQEFAQANIQPSLDHFRTLFINHLTELKMYPLSEVIATFNSTRAPNVLELIIEDQVPLNLKSHHPVGQPADYSFCSTPWASSFWWTQSNFAIPFKNIKKLHQVLDHEDKLKEAIESILHDRVFNKYFVEPLQKNLLTDAWLWHFLYLAMPYGICLGPANADDPQIMVPKYRLLNLRYSHHQLIMEIMDDEGIHILSAKILHDTFKKALFINIIRQAINHYHAQNYQEDAEQNPEFHYWLQDYLTDLINLCKIRKTHGRSTVYNANTNRPFILVDGQPHYLPFDLLTSFQHLDGDYYRAVLPTHTNNSSDPCTVLERRHMTINCCSLAPHQPFTSQSSWYIRPTEEEQKHLDLYWA